MQWTHYIFVGAIFAALGVGLGAFGAHGLKDKISVEHLAIFETAVRYQMYHALALVGVGVVATRIDSTALKVSAIALMVGILLFSGSLYTLSLTTWRTVGFLTPFGGLAFIVGWVALAISVLGLGA